VTSANRYRIARSIPVCFCLLWLILLLGVIGMLAIGGRSDPPGAGLALDGEWRFHAGDDPAWAGPETDDSGWDRIELASRPESHDGDVGIPGYLDGWRARGHPDLEGYGWYRRDVILPRQGSFALVAPPAVDDGYEMFWNGRPIGGVGRLSGTPRVNATRPFLVRLPDTHGEPRAVLAIRAFMQPGIGRDNQSGGLRTVPILASIADGERLHRAQWHRTVAGYVVDAAEPVAMLVLAIMAVVAAPALARPAFGRWIALALTASACLRLGNALSAWTDLLSLPALLWQNGVVLVPMAMLAWTIAWNQWADGASRRPVSWAAAAAWVAAVIGALSHNAYFSGCARALFAASLTVIAIRIARVGERKWLALPAMLLTVAGLFASDLSALGIPSIWFPFNIGVSRSQYAYALLLPLIAFLLAASRHPGAANPAPR
jgi:hypothetical protein